MVDETRKILEDENMRITTTCVRIPVKYAHSLSINLEFEKEFEIEEVFEILKNAPGVTLKDNLAENVYPMAIDAAGSDGVYVGRIRRDFSLDSGINLWVVADNVRKGAALNAVQIAEKLIEIK